MKSLTQSPNAILKAAGQLLIFRQKKSVRFYPEGNVLAETACESLPQKEIFQLRHYSEPSNENDKEGTHLPCAIDIGAIADAGLFNLVRDSDL
jgi:hypothetical protein